MAQRSKEASEAGFTLVELMIVVGMAAILMAILVLGVRQITESFALRRAAALVASELRRAHDGAISQGVNYTVEFLLNPSGLRVHRPAGRPVGAVVAAVSNGADTRVVTVNGYAGGAAVTRAITLSGTGEIVDSTSLDGILSVSVSAADSNRTITFRAGSLGPTVATIGPGQTSVDFPCPTGSLLSADSSWCVRETEWPSGIAVSGGNTTFPACTSPGTGTNKCVSFAPFGAPIPDSTNTVQLCSGFNVPVRIEVVQATGRVRTERAGGCP